MIIVTGASKGLGKAICERLLSENYKVLGLARDVSKINFDSMACDVSKYEDIKFVSEMLKKDHAEVTGLINAAGIASMNLVITTPPSTIRNIIETNLLGTIYCCQLLSPFMIRRKSGVIINFSTIAVALGLKGEAVYSASKAGVEAFSRAFAREMSSFNIAVNCVAPGPIDTALLKGVSKAQIDKIVDAQIIPKQFSPEEISDVVEMLLDKRSASLSGQVFNIGGA